MIRARIGALGTLLLAALTSTGCALLGQVLGFEEQMAQARQTARISGQAGSEGPAEGPLIVILARLEDGERLVGVDSFVRRLPGPYVFVVAPGRYQVGVYEDRNQNGLLDPGERTRANRDGPVLEVGPGGHATDDVILAANATSPPEVAAPVNVLDIVARTPQEQRDFSLWALSVQGEVCEDLSDPAFGPAAGVRGLWQPMDFLVAGEAGIHFLEPYDPDRVPVLFVHGISGYPQEFTTLIDSLDRERFQPWFYAYPSGFALEGVSSHLAAILDRLDVQYAFDDVAIVAHSMGGLVARGALFKYWDETGEPDVKLFVTLSTPWGGATSAESADRAPIELPPVFADMAPDSDYLRWLFYRDEAGRVPKPLPRGVVHHLMFGFHMSGRGRTAADGSVTVASQARLEAQEQAASVRAFDRGHVEILSAPEAVERVNRLLAETFR